MDALPRLLITAGVILIISGLVFTFISNSTGIGRLPGDIFIRRGNFTFYFPIVTSILISIVLTIIFNIFFRK